jgi:arylsulfatase A-like enzyme
VLFLVLDGLSPRHVRDDVMPGLSSLARDGGWSRDGGIGVMPSLTYPNHATFVTGVVPIRHGILGNQLATAQGVVPSWEQGPSAPTLFDAMRSAGRPSAAVFGDHHLVGVTGASSADFVWPIGGQFGADVDVDLLRYAKDRETVQRILEAVDVGAELVFAQLNEPDTAAHVFGPDSSDACERYGRTDTQVGVVIEALRSEWDQWVVIVVSDHSQEAVIEPVPIDLGAAGRSLGLEGLVVDDGAVALIVGEMARDDRWMRELPGVDGVQRLDDDTVLAWVTEGRWFSTVELPVRGVHGSPRTLPQVAVVTGGHPAVKGLGELIAGDRPQATWWAGAVAQLLAISAPADLEPGVGSARST